MRRNARVSALMMLLLAALLSGCGRVDNSFVTKKYAEMTGFSASVKIELNHGDSVTFYTLDYAWAKGEGHTLTVVKPDTMAGLEAKIDEGKTEVLYQGKIFIPKSLEGTGASPIKLLPDILTSWACGVVEGEAREELNGVECAVLDIYYKTDGDEFLSRTWFALESGLPVMTETFFGKTRVMVCRFENPEVT